MNYTVENFTMFNDTNITTTVASIVFNVSQQMSETKYCVGGWDDLQKR